MYGAQEVRKKLKAMDIEAEVGHTGLHSLAIDSMDPEMVLAYMLTLQTKSAITWFAHSYQGNLF